MPLDSEKPSETELIKKRLVKLETRAWKSTIAASRARLTTAGFTGGAVALFLSMSVPWARHDNSWGLAITSDGSLRIGEARGFATGWEMVGEVFGEAYWPLTAAFLALLALLMVTVAGLFFASKPLLVTSQVLAAVVPPLFLFGWPRGGSGPDVVTAAVPGPGPMIVAVACVVVGATAQWAKHEDSRFPGH